MIRSKGFFGDTIEAEHRVRIKICGITNAADAQAAIDAGADALGFNFFPGSPRYIDISSANEWMAKLPAHIRKVAVLVNPAINEAIRIADSVNSLQLHGGESPSFCRSLAGRGIAFAKAIGVRDKESLQEFADFSTDTILLDSKSKNFGGSGQTFSWTVAKNFVKEHRDLHVILAGGLNPENVNAAIEQVRPFAVDVTSGVEFSPGRKDRARLRAFVAAVRG